MTRLETKTHENMEEVCPMIASMDGGSLKEETMYVASTRMSESQQHHLSSSKTGAAMAVLAVPVVPALYEGKIY